MASAASDIIDDVIHRAVDELRDAEPGVVTFALYFDHESSAVSVCADTETNSKKCIAAANAYTLPYFVKAIDAGDLKGAALWQGTFGRSLSLGDFAFVNLARQDVPAHLVDEAWYVAMTQGLVRHTETVLRVCDSNVSPVFVVSTATDEVGLVWCPARI